jgi:hypothetical protein
VENKRKMKEKNGRGKIPWLLVQEREQWFVERRQTFSL